MPNAPLGFCTTRRCPNRAPAGKRCEACRRAHGEARHASEDPRYGTQRWRKYSKQRLAQHPWCVDCGLLAEVTDHVLPVTTHPELFWTESNHASRCQGCNKRRAGIFGRPSTPGGEPKC